MDEAREKSQRKNIEKHTAAIDWLQQQVWNQPSEGGQHAMRVLWMLVMPSSVHPTVREYAGEKTGNIFNLDPLPVPTAVDWEEGA